MPDIDWDMLRDKAIQVAMGAYAPYSQFPVGAASLVDDGRVVEDGSPRDLIGGTGRYAALHQAWADSLV